MNPPTNKPQTGMSTRLVIGITLLAWCFLPGCIGQGDVAVRSEFKACDKVAIWPHFEGRATEGGLQRVHEEVFLPCYMQAFPHQRMIERRDLNAILGEQDMLPDRLNKETRAKLREIYGVKGIVFPNYTAGSECQLALKVIDTETGEVVAALVVTDRPDQDGNQPVARLIRQAIAKLKDAANRSGATS